MHFVSPRWAALTVGSVYFEPLSHTTASILSDPSFTGRVTLWEFGLDNIGHNFWFGNGYDSFWGTSVVKETEAPFYSPWDFRGISNGHSNYIDMILVVFVAPAVNYLKFVPHPGQPQSGRSVHDDSSSSWPCCIFFETFLIGRVHQVWLCLIIAITGLQLTSRYRIA